MTLFVRFLLAIEGGDCHRWRSPAEAVYIYRRRSLSLTWFVLAAAVLAVSTAPGALGQTCNRFLNATEGDDGNGGTSRASAVKSFEHAFLSFPSGSVVCMTAGEYISGGDADGIQLQGADAIDKSMQFVLESFGGATAIAFTEDDFKVDIGSGVLKFVAGSSNKLFLGQGSINDPARFPSNTNFLHSLSLTSGTVDATGVDLEIGNSVGNPLYVHPISGKSFPNAAIVRGVGTISGIDVYSSEPKVLRYVGDGDRTAAAELPPAILRLELEHVGGVVTINDFLPFAEGGVLISRAGGDAVISSDIQLSGLAISTSGSGQLRFTGSTFLEPTSAIETVALNSGPGTLGFNNLNISSPSGALGSVVASLVNAGSGILEIHRLQELASGATLRVKVENRSAGKLLIGHDQGSSFQGEIENLEGGTVEVAGPTVLADVVVNSGELLLRGAVEIASRFLNSGLARLLNDVVVSGVLENSGNVQLGAQTLTILSPGPHQNSGTIESEADGGVRLAASVILDGAGRIANIISESGESTVSASAVTGDVVIEDDAVLRFVRADSISGNVLLDGGELRLPAAVVVGELTVQNGDLQLEGDVHLLSRFLQRSSGAVNLNGNTLLLSGDFEREGGVFESREGSLLFNGTPVQTFTPGPGLVLDRLVVEQTRVILAGAGVDIVDSLIVSEGSELLLFDFEIQLIGLSSTVRNEGRISSSITGTLRFAGPSGSSQRLEGGGLYGNLDVDLSNEYDLVVADGDVMRQSGFLSLTSGTLRIDAGTRYILTDENGTPFIRRNLGDENGDGAPDSKGVLANESGTGSFETPPAGYSIEYSGTFGGRSQIGAEFISGGIADLHVSIRGIGPIPAILELTTDLTFSGSLNLSEQSILDLQNHDLTSLGVGSIHSVLGSIQATTGSFVVKGSGRVSGQESSGSIKNISASSPGLLDITELRIPGKLEVHSGKTALALSTHGGDASPAASIGAIAIYGGELALERPATVQDSLLVAGGQLDHGQNDIVMGPGSDFVLSGGGSVEESGSGSIAFVGNGTIEAGGAGVPRLRLEAANDDRVKLSGPTRIGQSLVHESGVLDLQAHDLVHEGRLWRYVGGKYEGTGSVVIQGSVSIELFNDVTLPNLRLQGASDETAVILKTAEDSAHSVTIYGTLRIEKGTLDLGSHDIILDNGILSYSGGAVTASDANFYDAFDPGELIFSDSAIELARELLLPNVRLLRDATITSQSAPLHISNRVHFEEGSLVFDDSLGVVLEAGAEIVRSGSGTFSRRPSAAGMLRLVYHLPDTLLPNGTLRTGLEVPEEPVESLSIDAGPNTVDVQSRIRIERELLLLSGILAAEESELIVASGATVHLDYSGSVQPGFSVDGYTTTGPVILMFSGSAGDLTTTDFSLPSGADSLVVRMENEANLVVHGNRRIRTVHVQSDERSGLDLNGKSLLVDEDVTVSSGLITSAVEAVLEIEGDLTTEAASLVTGVVSATVLGETVIRGTFDAFLLRSSGNVHVHGRLGGPSSPPDATTETLVVGIPNLRLVGLDQTLTFSNADDDPLSLDDAVNQLTIDLQDSTGRVVLASTGDLHTLGVNQLLLMNGLLVTGENDIRLPHNGAGFQRKDNAQSHVFGRISRRIHAGQPNPFAEAFGRFSYPVGGDDSISEYRPVTLAFTDENPLSVTTVLSIKSVDSPPEGYLGFPSDGGDGVSLDDKSSFYWMLESKPRLPSGQLFNLEVLAEDFASFSAARNLRLLRRSDGDPSSHPWSLQGNSAQYDNAVVSFDGRPVPFIQVVQTSGGVSQEGEILAIGIEHDIIPFARVQLIHAHENVGEVQLLSRDSVVTEYVGHGRATAYARIPAGNRFLSVVTRQAATAAADTFSVEAGRDYVLLLSDHREEPALLMVQNAQATPGFDSKSAVSVAFLHAASGSTALSLRDRDNDMFYFQEIPFGSMSSSYVPLEPVDMGFDVVAGAGAVTSARADLSEQAGLTLVAVAGDSDSESGGPITLFLVNNHGEIVPSHVQVAADEAGEIPARFSLHGNYPNPFNPSTSVVFDLPEVAEVMVEVYDLLGRAVMTVQGGTMSAGVRRTVGVDASGLASGMYLYRVVAETAGKTHMASGTMTLVK